MDIRPVSEQVFFVVAALAAGSLHGYAVLAEVAELSGDRISMAVGTLYGILDRLAASGKIELDREELVDSRLRRYYRLTPEGWRLLEAEVARQEANARVGAGRLRGVTRLAMGTS